MIRINQLAMPISHTKEQLEHKICSTLGISAERLISYEIERRSIDARKKQDVHYSYTIVVSFTQESAFWKNKKNRSNRMIAPYEKKKYHIMTCDSPNKIRPVIVGDGPAGLFAAYALMKAGLAPLVIERGKPIAARQKDVTTFWETGILDPESNVQFGEGGAGTFSDGKLNTLVKDTDGRNRFVLETFVRYGAPDHILYEQKPHIGTDVLSLVITNMRRDMEASGVTFRFETCMTDYRAKQGDRKEIEAIELNHTEWIPVTTLVLAIGHSARDTFRLLAEKEQLAMEPKSFAVGYRVEHPQEMISKNQYGELFFGKLPAAPYKVTAKTTNGRGVYSFCMCPGGYVVNASSVAGQLAVNGMSYSGRSGANANSAIIVSVTPEDFAPYANGEHHDVLSGVRFQEALEKKAYALANGAIPQQLFGDYCEKKATTEYGAFSSTAKGETAFVNLRGLLPLSIEESFIEGMHHFSRMIPSFDRPDAILSAIESRTSSPVRIPRNEQFVSAIEGLYPCGEGAGYAGGIMSAAMDGLKVAEAILKNKTTDRI